MEPVPFVPDIAAIAADLAKSPLHIDPSLQGEFTPEQIATITKNIEASPTPIHVIAVPLTRESDLSPVQLMTLAHREAPQDGIWLVTTQSYAGRWDLDATTYGVAAGNDANLAGYAATKLYPTDLGLQVQKYTELIATGTAREAWDAAYPEASEASTLKPDDGKQVFGVDLPVAAVGLGVLALLVAVIATKRRRIVAGRDEVAVKGRALKRISAAQTDAWRHRATEATTLLGEQINAHQIDANSDRLAWTAALDHYDAAVRILDRSPSAADSIGVIVLAGRGTDALQHALAGSAWEPSPTCFFNPLHGAATSTAKWQTAAGTRNVPCCQACRRLVSKRKEPEFLDLPVGDTVVHYVDADESAEPWASTGYGSLTPDLLPEIR